LDLSVQESDQGAQAIDQGALAMVMDSLDGDLRLAQMRQVHGCEVAVVSAPGWSTADALVTTHPGLALLVRSADCVPVLLSSAQGVIGAVHAGREGMALGVVPSIVDNMRLLGAQQISAWIGPHICGSCYEVPLDLQQRVGRLVPEAICTTRKGTSGLDLGAGVISQLHESGVEVEYVGGCTLEGADFHSFRRDGEMAGRQAGIIWLPKGDENDDQGWPG
jgi:YfiH family protein